jgi:predicted TIM-barrel fold metal-dependent hydrolase
MIIDCHCHAGTGDGFTGPWDTRASIDGYLARAAAAGIDRTVVFAAFHSDYACANREVAGLVARHPGRLFGFAFVHAARDRGRVAAMIREAVLEHGFSGIKVHRHDARLTREVCEVAQRWALPLLYDVAGEIASVRLFARDYPRVRFIIPHLGSFADDWAAQTAFVHELADHPNVFTDTSGVRRFDVLEEAVRRAGPHKILFGSDGPWLHPALELAKIRALALPPRAESLVLGGNLLRVAPRAGARLQGSRFARSSWSARSVTLSNRDADWTL